MMTEKKPHKRIRRLPITRDALLKRQLKTDAPIPSYEIDKILKGPLFKNGMVPDKEVRQFRHAANSAALLAIAEMEQYAEMPDRFELAKTFFDEHFDLFY
jgi:hypothetical protein